MPENTNQPDLAVIEAIARLDDPVPRNLRITQCYHELSKAMAERSGTLANWCTFATWASKQAGQTIRGEDLARSLEAALRPEPGAGTTRGPGADPLAPGDSAARGVAESARELGAQDDAAGIEDSLWAALDPAAVAARAAAAVARGNKKVFEEIAREFARFFDACLGDNQADEAHLALFRSGLRPGEPPDGQDLLGRAFGHYYEAFFETDDKRRMELLLLGNLEIGFHEQTRLQPEIAESLSLSGLDAAELRRRVLAANFPWRGWLVRLRLFATRLFRGPTPLDRAIEAFLARARRRARRVITAQLMTLALPGGPRLRLGQDLGRAFPPELEQVEHPELRALLARIDPTPDSLIASAAADWADLGERLHFIADLFRCYAVAPELLEPPFSAEQARLIEAGRVPEGLL